MGELSWDIYSVQQAAIENKIPEVQGFRKFHVCHWIGLRENLQETIDFPIFSMGLSCIFSLKPIH
jgi:hypothetical protein